MMILRVELERMQWEARVGDMVTGQMAKEED